MPYPEEVNQQRQQLRLWLHEEVAGQQVQHEKFEAPIVLNWKGLKHCLSNTSSKPSHQFHALRQLPQILEEAEYSRYEPDNHTPPRKGVGVHVFYAMCELDNQPYQVSLRVRETPDGFYFYDLGVVR